MALSKVDNVLRGRVLEEDDSGMFQEVDGDLPGFREGVVWNYPCA